MVRCGRCCRSGGSARFCDSGICYTISVDIVSRVEACAAGRKRYFTGKPCKRGHIAQRLTANKACLVCHREYFRPRMAAAAAKNPEVFRERARVYAAKNPEKLIAYRRATTKRARIRQHLRFDLNPGLNAAYVAARKAYRLKATPVWLSPADHELMRFLYREAAGLSSYTGVKFHVDHIVPLKGQTVCGLHVPWNLRVIAASQNLGKHNALPDEKDFVAVE